MASVGPKYPTSEVSSNANGGTVAAQNTPNLDDGAGEVYWVFTPNSNENTERLACTGFDFSDIPDNAIIRGIAVTRVCRAEIFDGSTQITGGVAQLVLDGSAIGNTDSWSSQPQVEEAESMVGGESSLWGATLTAEDVKDSTFGVRFEHESINGPGDPNQLYYKSLSMTVYYTLPANGGIGSATFNRLLVPGAR